MYLGAGWIWSQNTQIGVVDLSPTNCMTLGMTLLSRPQLPYQMNKGCIKRDKTFMKALKTTVHYK